MWPLGLWAYAEGTLLLFCCPLFSFSASNASLGQPWLGQGLVTMVCSHQLAGCLDWCEAWSLRALRCSEATVRGIAALSRLKIDGFLVPYSTLARIGGGAVEFNAECRA